MPVRTWSRSQTSSSASPLVTRPGVARRCGAACSGSLGALARELRSAALVAAPSRLAAHAAAKSAGSSASGHAVGGPEQEQAEGVLAGELPAGAAAPVCGPAQVDHGLVRLPPLPDRRPQTRSRTLRCPTTERAWTGAPGVERGRVGRERQHLLGGPAGPHAGRLARTPSLGRTAVSHLPQLDVEMVGRMRTRPG